MAEQKKDEKLYRRRYKTLAEHQAAVAARKQLEGGKNVGPVADREAYGEQIKPKSQAKPAPKPAAKPMAKPAPQRAAAAPKPAAKPAAKPAEKKPAKPPARMTPAVSSLFIGPEATKAMSNKPKPKPKPRSRGRRRGAA